MADAVLVEYPSRMQGDMIVQVLGDERIPAVVFVDVARGPQGEILYERAAVRVRLEDLERARSVLEAWDAARAQGIDAAELERQALEAGGADRATAGASPAATESPAREADARRRPAREALPGIVCPHCGATVAPGFPDRLRRGVAALVGRSASPRGERLCTVCGHRWDPGDAARG